MKKLLVFAMLLAAALILSGCARHAPITQPSLPEPDKLNDKGQAICENHFCLYRHFQNCTPAVMKFPVREGGEYEISIEGIVDGKCRNTRIINGAGVDCLYPMEEMTEQAFNHMFGSDRFPGMEETMQKQSTLMKAYCRQV